MTSKIPCGAFGAAKSSNFWHFGPNMCYFLKCFKTYFEPKKLISKKNSCWKFFWDLTIYWQKCLKSENFRKKSNFFEIDLECFKTNFKPKKLISKKISAENFFWDSAFFWRNWPKREIFRRNFVVCRARSFQFESYDCLQPSSIQVCSDY